MENQGVDPSLLKAWLSARSIARGMPLPVPDYGGYRVDTDTEEEAARWVFPKVGAGLKELARTIHQPRHFLKLCGAPKELEAILPEHWMVHSPGYFMQGPLEAPSILIPDGYRIETKCEGVLSQVKIFCRDSELAASGFAVETLDVFIFDRIITEPGHRRRGLGSAMIAALRTMRRESRLKEVLVATQEGRALYAKLGWAVLSPYATASIKQA